MKLTINTDPDKYALDTPGMEVGLDSINAWLALKQISPYYMHYGDHHFGMDMTDGTRLLFVWDTHGGRITVTPPKKQK